MHFFGLMTKVPPFSEMATFGHSASQAEQFVHCDEMILYAIADFPFVPFLRGLDQRALADFRIAARLMDDLAALDLFEIGLEPGDRLFLDEFMRIFIDRIDAGLLQIALRTAADFRHENRMAIVDRADHRLQ